MTMYRQEVTEDAETQGTWSEVMRSTNHLGMARLRPGMWCEVATGKVGPVQQYLESSLKRIYSG